MDMPRHPPAHQRHPGTGLGSPQRPGDAQGLPAGLRQFESTGENQYAVTMAVKVGGVGKFAARCAQRHQPPHELQAGLRGRGGVAGFGKGASTVSLRQRHSAAARLHRAGAGRRQDRAAGPAPDRWRGQVDGRRLLQALQPPRCNAATARRRPGRCYRMERLPRKTGAVAGFMQKLGFSRRTRPRARRTKVERHGRPRRHGAAPVARLAPGENADALLATVVRTWGSSPRPISSILARWQKTAPWSVRCRRLHRDDLIAATAASGIRRCRAARRPRSSTASPPTRAHRFGLPCGGTLELLLEFDPDPASWRTRQRLGDQLMQHHRGLADGAVALALRMHPPNW